MQSKKNKTTVFFFPETRVRKDKKRTLLSFLRDAEQREQVSHDNTNSSKVEKFAWDFGPKAPFLISFLFPWGSRDCRPMSAFLRARLPAPNNRPKLAILRQPCVDQKNFVYVCSLRYIYINYIFFHGFSRTQDFFVPIKVSRP